ncbi:chorismate mutase [Desulfohalobium retbaense]|uniref:EPSP synthase (3-phosphoshikimate 1-carboxyvinyltransferase) n=1 Tax=Desulfohalobium retbaense (strain ATCC 49708 / DSM 5692 / JCM 16813 / HR100) TaxID=485915 RepID=C8X3Q5_DESRD|nr:chorismate mutase [Desulfohalobium retbaense]ACV69052.1 EPSP synthase (3-phosphoshikimate 1- carboxyvinyltransferase) [Desulfohalobium retbaense DSM 5692]
MTHDKKSAPPLTNQLLRLDRDLTKMLIRRSQLLAQSAQERKERKQSLVDPGQEKRLWVLWQQVLQESGMDPRHWRHIFQTINGLAYGQAERTPDRPLTVYPATSAMDVDLPGPTDTAEARLWSTAALASGQPLQLNGVLANDTLHEFVTAANQVEASLSRQEEQLACPADTTLHFNGATVHAGGDFFNLALVMMLSLPEPGNTKITGSSLLRLEDLSLTTELFAQLGSRLVFLTPGSNSVPLRMERSGHLPAEVDFPDQAPAAFLAALLMAGLRFPRRCVIRWGDRHADAPEVIRALDILERIGVTISRSERTVAIDPGRAQLPQSVTPGLDPVLSSFLLALPRIKGGQVRLQGRLDTANPVTQSMLGILGASGLHCDHDAQAVVSTLQEGTTLDRLRGYGPILPLATALSAITGATLQVDDPAERRAVVSFLDQLACPYKITDHGLNPGKPSAAPELPFAAEGPNWGLAGALYGLRFGPLQYANPGDISSAWPKFWRIMRHLPKPQAAPQTPKTEATDNGKRRRRRIVK